VKPSRFMRVALSTDVA